MMDRRRSLLDGLGVSFSWRLAGIGHKREEKHAIRRMMITVIKKIINREILRMLQSEVDKKGGSTLRIHNSLIRPFSLTEGYLVSPYKDCETVLELEDFSIKTIKEFIVRNIEILRSPDHYLGLWKYNGSYYIDVSVYVKSEQTAYEIARAADQEAFFCIRTGRPISLQSIINESRAMLEEYKRKESLRRRRWIDDE